MDSHNWWLFCSLNVVRYFSRSAMISASDPENVSNKAKNRGLKNAFLSNNGKKGVPKRPFLSNHACDQYLMSAANDLAQKFETDDLTP
ncbi:MAG: hypothetical protein KGS72_14845 [Cyanobacteria bacterium REEB67]|nr:hypothetical protein [Cyanobacteria bacterium REEB67]